LPGKYTEIDPETGKGAELDVEKDSYSIIQILGWINSGKRQRSLVPLLSAEESALARAASTSTLTLHTAHLNDTNEENEIKARLQNWELQPLEDPEPSMSKRVGKKAGEEKILLLRKGEKKRGNNKQVAH